MSFKKRYTDEQLITAIASHDSYADVLRSLGETISGASNRRLRQGIQRLGLDINHIKPKMAHLRNFKPGHSPKNKVCVHDIISGKATYKNTYNLKLKLFNAGLKIKECEQCGLDTWMGTVIPLHLHHKDGNRENNLWENLQILCPNCHAQTDSYCGKNKGVNSK